MKLTEKRRTEAAAELRNIATWINRHADALEAGDAEEQTLGDLVNDTTAIAKLASELQDETR